MDPLSEPEPPNPDLAFALFVNELLDSLNVGCAMAPKGISPPISRDVKDKWNGTRTWSQLERVLTREFGHPFNASRALSPDEAKLVVKALETIGPAEVGLLQAGESEWDFVDAMVWFAFVADALRGPGSRSAFGAGSSHSPGSSGSGAGAGASAHDLADETSSATDDSPGFVDPSAISGKRKRTSSTETPSAPEPVPPPPPPSSVSNPPPLGSRAAAFAAKMSALAHSIPSVSSSAPSSSPASTDRPSTGPLAGSSSSTGLAPASFSTQIDRAPPNPALDAAPVLQSASAASAPSFDAPSNPKKPRAPPKSRQRRPSMDTASLLQGEAFVPSPRESVSNRPQRERKLPSKIAHSAGLIDADGVPFDSSSRTEGGGSSTRRKRKSSVGGGGERGARGPADDEMEEIDELASDPEVEDPRATGTAVKRWKVGETAFVRFPNYGWWISAILDPATAPPTTQGKRVRGAYLAKSIPTGADHRWVPAESTSIRPITEQELSEIESGVYAKDPEREHPVPKSWSKWRGEILEAVEIVRSEQALSSWLSQKTDLEIRMDAERERKKQARGMKAW
ncbi:hypothetical protein JCM10212_002182 [Sporobolomyces blumeae]